MSRCWLEGELRAHFDCELPARDMGAIERHLKECAACAALAGELSRRAARVGALIQALEEIPEARAGAAEPAAQQWRSRAVVAGLLAAACLSAAVWIAPWRQPPRAPVKPRITKAIVAAQDNPILPQLKLEPAPRAAVKERPAPPQYYIALDDEPLDSGVVVRVALPDTGLLADVIYDEQGRPRAVRPLN